MSHIPTGRTNTIFEPAGNDGDEILLPLISFDVGYELVDVLRSAFNLLEHIGVVGGQEPTDPEDAVHLLADVEDGVQRVHSVDFADLEEPQQVAVLVVVDLLHDAVECHVEEEGVLVHDHEHHQVQVGIFLQHEQCLELDDRVGFGLVDARTLDEQPSLLLLVAAADCVDLQQLFLLEG